jgi:hypothetical protein
MVGELQRRYDSHVEPHRRAGRSSRPRIIEVFQDLDAVGELFPPSELARAFVAEGAFSPSPVTRIDVVSAISEQVRREMAVYDLQNNINTRVL